MSTLDAALKEYLATRRALGTQLKWPASSLRRFVEFVEAQGADFVTTDLALRWAVQPVGVQRATHAGRLRIVRGFATWLQATDRRTQVPPHRLLPAQQRRPTPYIYSNHEIVEIVAASDSFRSLSRRATFKTLIGLLAATGLRPGEALALDIADVDLISGVLSVRYSKFGKSRFVPLDESARMAMIAYAAFRDTVHPRRETSAFFVSKRGLRLRPGATRRTFALLCQQVSLRSPSAPRRIGRGPRLQDMRHTFATRRLIEWYRAGLDVDRLMPRLATYLGHGHVAETYWYIQAVPELLQLATERIETAARGDSR
ncbi:MAG: tyrosine-type recombinase/integrase [Gemmatimonadaceae bacterium]|nr:tyrosine-type recombinase/integrase [Gemmatimonadaceae bacterium]